MSVPSVESGVPASLKNSSLWNALRHLKHSLIIRFAKRENRVYTRFNRFPSQFRALVEKVMPRIRPGAITADTAPLEIVVFACCSGAEVFSLSWLLRQNFPQLRYRIRGFDIVDSVIQQARAGVFTREEVFQGPFATADFVDATFDLVDGKYHVKRSIAEPTSFAVGSLLDKPLMDSLAGADIVVAQNVLFHLPRPQARTAFGYLHDMLRPGGAMFINGMDTDMRVSLTKKLKMEPLDFLVEEIHQDASIDRGGGWAGAYWGRRPFSRNSRDWLRKYGTIYFRTS